VEDNDYLQPPRDPLFRLARAILFEMDPERAHDLALGLLSRAPIPRILAQRYATDSSPITCLGQTFANRIGLGAGLDKNGDYIDALGAIGFGHLEVGTVTPLPQAGNPKPRIFRLVQHGALINRLGFNNKGVDHLVSRVQQRHYRGRLGINIGKNATTSLDDAVNDYLYCLERVYPHADYITINISSPNTTGLRDLQHGDRLARLLSTLKTAQLRLATTHGQHVPIAVKIAPDMSDDELDEFCLAVLAHDIEAVIAGNTTREREPVNNHLYARETGGLSGAPLKKLADDRLQAVVTRLQGKAELIGVGGVSCGADAQLKRRLGADLVQLYTGFIYHGPALVRDCIECTSAYESDCHPAHTGVSS
jgi:dihydroorotate dehydrogenase